MNRKTLVMPAVAGLLAPLLAACGASEESRAIVVGTTDQFTATEDAPAPLDPAFAYDTGAWNILRQTVQTLLHVPRGGGEPVPEAARSCGFTDKASESYRCTLRPGLTFADGTPVTAEDVKYSVERVLKIKSDNGTAALLSNIDTVETKGDEIVFHLKTPDATFPYKLSTPVAG
ncbi:ABC transporter substrate-binding protein, partial [Streptomyces sp.]